MGKIINNRMRLRWVATVLLSLPTAMLTAANEADFAAPSRWYVGVDGGVPFGISTFSSFGADKTHVGFSVGAFVGYRLSPALSLEMAAAKFGKATLSARQCCVDAGYWLGSDGIRYNAPALGTDGWNYSDLKSSVAIQRYGVRLNVNLLGFFPATKSSRWTLGLAPEISAVGTKATVETLSDDATVMKGNNNWHLGLGCNVQVGYRITNTLGIGAYSGLTHLTGSRLDGMPEHPHKTNLVWESGVRFTLDLTYRKEGRK